MLDEINYDGQLSPAAYTILALMLAIIIGGFSWCFYRAISATDKDASEQYPDEI